MTKKLIERIDERSGMLISLCGFVVAAIGATMIFIWPLAIGRVIARLGILIGLGGVVTHFVVNWRAIFTLGADRND